MEKRKLYVLPTQDLVQKVSEAMVEHNVVVMDYVTVNDIVVQSAIAIGFNRRPERNQPYAMIEDLVNDKMEGLRIEIDEEELGITDENILALNADLSEVALIMHKRMVDLNVETYQVVTVNVMDEAPSGDLVIEFVYDTYL